MNAISTLVISIGRAAGGAGSVRRLAGWLAAFAGRGASAGWLITLPPPICGHRGITGAFWRGRDDGRFCHSARAPFWCALRVLIFALGLLSATAAQANHQANLSLSGFPSQGQLLRVENPSSVAEGHPPGGIFAYHGSVLQSVSDPDLFSRP